MTPDRFGVQVGLTSSGIQSPKHRSFGGRVFAQLAATKDNYNDYGFLANFYFYLAKDSGTITYSTAYVNNDESVFGTITDGTDRNGWYTDTSSDKHVNTKVIVDFEDNQDPMPKKLKGAYAFTGSELTETAVHAIYAIFFDFNVDNPTTQETLEYNGRHDPTVTTIYDWSPQDENESCSAWVMKQQVLSNTNRILQETTGAWTVPLFDDEVPYT
jgi:hypothetical protein